MHKRYLAGCAAKQARVYHKDYVLAHIWSNIAAAKGVKNAQKIRGIIAGKMTLTDIEIAQKIAGECLESGYKNCGY